MIEVLTTIVGIALAVGLMDRGVPRARPPLPRRRRHGTGCSHYGLFLRIDGVLYRRHIVKLSDFQGRAN